MVPALVEPSSDGQQRLHVPHGAVGGEDNLHRLHHILTALTILSDDLAAAASEVPDRVALVTSESVSYAELWRRVEQMRSWLCQRLEPGARVLLLLDNSTDLVVFLYAIPAAGLIAVPLDTKVHPRNLAHVLADSEPGAVVYSSRKRLDNDLAWPPLRIDVDDPATMTAHVATHTDRHIDAEDPAIILYTTGTTGLPKGALLNHRALMAATRNINAFMELEPGVIELVAMPLTHSFGFGRLRCVVAVRGTAVLHQGLTRPAAFFEAVERHGVTSLALVPTACRMLLQNFAGAMSRIGEQVRFLELGSDFLERRYKEELVQTFPQARLCMHYGLTEASRSTFLDLRSDSDHLDTIGRPTPGVEVTICTEAGTPLGFDEVGEIWVRGSTVMLEYWRNPDATAAALKNGWLRTADLGVCQRDGYLRLLGRRNEMFKVAGLAVAPREIEAVLERHPAIREAAVLGAQVERATSIEVQAFLVLRGQDEPDFRELRRFCLTELEPHKVPSKFVVVSSLPRTASGKLQRAEVARINIKQ